MAATFVFTCCCAKWIGDKITQQTGNQSQIRGKRRKQRPSQIKAITSQGRLEWGMKILDDIPPGTCTATGSHLNNNTKLTCEIN